MVKISLIIFPICNSFVPDISSTISISIGKISVLIDTPGDFIKLKSIICIHGCSLICCMVNLLSGFFSNILYIKSLNKGETKSGTSTFFFTISLTKSLLSSPLKGKSPHTMRYRQMPILQISAIFPLNSIPLNTSGAAYIGDPPVLLNLIPPSKLLLNPKSVNFASPYSSNIIFSSFISK